MKTIYDFNKGDEIVRIQPAKECINLNGISFRDRSYLGEKLIFVGVTNGQIYFKRTESFALSIFGDKLYNLSLDIWDEGWNFYIDPNKFFVKELRKEKLEKIESEIKLDKSILEEQLKKAIETENYELAEKLKKKLEE